MSIPKSVLNYLDKNNVKYEIIEHKTAYTALDSSETQHIDPKIVVKTLVMKLDSKGYALALLSANRNIDRAKFKKVVNAWREKSVEKTVKKVDFAKEAWMKENIAGKVGATPPFGKLLKMPVFIDSLVLKNQKIIVNAGDYNYSIKLSAKQFEKLEEPVKASFGMAKKIKRPKQSKPKRGKGSGKAKSKKKPRSAPSASRRSKKDNRRSGRTSQPKRRKK